MTATDLVDRLARHHTIGMAPRDELAWLSAHGTLRQLDAGEMLSAKGERVEELFVLLSGRVAIRIDRGAGVNRTLEWRGGDVTGLLPYSRLTHPPGDSVAEEPSTILAVHREHFPAMIRECHEVTAILVHTMLDRARFFTSSDLHDEKMASLGKLAAGLAHELNNPASAIERSAGRLVDALEDTERATRALGASRLTESQLDTVDAVRTSCLIARVQGVRSPVEQAEHEEVIADWLADHGIDVALADALADTAVTIEELDRLAGAVDAPALGAVLRWAAAECTVRGLASEIQDAALHISGLVAAVKGFTHMDQAQAAAPVDLAQGLRNTIAVLRSKARAKAATVALEVEPGLPPARGFAGELNQIWSNLIDNALDAIPDSGRVEVRAAFEQRRVVVRIIDDGSGIPEGVRERIFDPFFTTKPVGLGTGLGLDIVRRLVRHNDGDISVESRPGRTEFRVALPPAEDSTGARW